MLPPFANIGPPGLAVTAGVIAFVVYALIVGLVWLGIRRARRKRLDSK